jgi:hypothetical protein
VPDVWRCADPWCPSPSSGVHAPWAPPAGLHARALPHARRPGPSPDTQASSRDRARPAVGGLGWEGVGGLGQRRVARQWSVGPRRAALADPDQRRLSADALEPSRPRSPQRRAARRQAPGPGAAASADGAAGRRASAGRHPEQGPATLSVVRALERPRVGCAEPLRARAPPAVQPRLVHARLGAERGGQGGRRWRADQPDACVRGLAAEGPGGPHRSGAPHCRREVATPGGAAASPAQGQRRRPARGLRALAREGWAAQHAPAAPPCPAVQAEERRGPPAPAAAGAREGGRAEGAAVRGLRHAAPGGPLHPPGLRLAAAVGEGQAALQGQLAAPPGGRLPPDSRGWPETATGG